MSIRPIAARRAGTGSNPCQHARSTHMAIQPKPATVKGPADWFTGDVWIDPIVGPRDGSQLSVAAVHFTPGARTAWHAHDGGQTLYLTEGRGLVQSRGEDV